MHRFLAALQILLAGAFAQEGITPSQSEIVAKLADTRINESSGLARSLRHEGIFWTMNDSGGEPCVFAIDLQGRTRAKVRVADAVNFDWEDLASGLDEQNKPVLYVGDIGDNFHARPTVQIYRIPEPDIAAEGAVVPETVSAASIHWHVTYPGGPQNAEGLLVHPKTHRIHILSKSEDGRSGLFAFPMGLDVLSMADKGRENANKPVLLEKLADVTFIGYERTGKRPSDDRQCTGAAFSPDGTSLVASTYSSLFEWRLPGGKPTPEALAANPVRMVPDLLRQLEAVTYDADGRTLWLTSEHLPTPLVRVKR
ncbi:MAG: hypothetical protein U1F81_17560 [Verrucomicrobiaceae bacterium]